MMAERLAEIRQACDTMPWGALPMVRELLDHIAQLEARVSTLLFTNGVLDSAAKDAQAWLCRAQTAEAKCAQLEAQRGGVVVVPPLDPKYLNKYHEKIHEVCFEEGYSLAAQLAEAIPANRVLADGMVGVDREELATLREIAGRWCPPFGVPHNMETVALFDRLRTQQAKGEVEG